MQLLGLSSMLLSTALASAPAPKASPSPSTEIELEIVDRTSATSFAFIVPLEGTVEAWIDRDGSPQRCEVSARGVHSGLRVHLDCGGPPQHALRVEATRTLAPGHRTRLAEVRRPGHDNRQVFATLR